MHTTKEQAAVFLKWEEVSIVPFVQKSNSLSHWYAAAMADNSWSILYFPGFLDPGLQVDTKQRHMLRIPYELLFSRFRDSKDILQEIVESLHTALGSRILGIFSFSLGGIMATRWAKTYSHTPIFMSHFPGEEYSLEKRARKIQLFKARPALFLQKRTPQDLEKNTTLWNTYFLLHWEAQLHLQTSALWLPKESSKCYPQVTRILPINDGFYSRKEYSSQVIQNSVILHLKHAIPSSPSHAYWQLWSRWKGHLSL